MSAVQIIEEEQGTCTGVRHPHNGYFAADFSVDGTGTSPTPWPLHVLRTAAHPSETTWA
jgi:hypothetical protein